MWRVFLVLPICLAMDPTYPEKPLSGFGPITMVDVPAHVQKGLPDPAKEPIAFLEACLKHYDETVKGYTLRFDKQERLKGELRPLEIVDACYRDHPYSVYFKWVLPPNNLIRRALYVEGENKGSDGRSQVKVLTPLGVLNKDPNGEEAKAQGRFTINMFGLRQAMQRVLDSWKEAQKEHTLKVDYLGVKKINILGDRECYVFERSHYARPEGDDGVAGLTIFIDSKTLLQVGSIVRNAQGQKLGEYYFQDIHLNPDFPPDQFTPAILKK